MKHTRWFFFVKYMSWQKYHFMMVRHQTKHDNNFTDPNVYLVRELEFMSCWPNELKIFLASFIVLVFCCVLNLWNVGWFYSFFWNFAQKCCWFSWLYRCCKGNLLVTIHVSMMGISWYFGNFCDTHCLTDQVRIFRKIR